MNLRDLIGSPWAVPCDPPRTFDCWELVRYARRAHGLRTPSVVEVGSRRPSDRKYIETPPTGWYRLDGPRTMAVVRIGANHVGVMLNPWDVLHCRMNYGVCIDRVTQLPDTTFWDLKQ